jgi:hypothetical protein
VSRKSTCVGEQKCNRQEQCLALIHTYSILRS